MSTLCKFEGLMIIFSFVSLKKKSCFLVYLLSSQFNVQVLREFNHVNPQDDEEGKEFSDTRVSHLTLCFPFEFYQSNNAAHLYHVGMKHFISQLYSLPLCLAK